MTLAHKFTKTTWFFKTTVKKIRQRHYQNLLTRHYHTRHKHTKTTYEKNDLAIVTSPKSHLEPKFSPTKSRLVYLIARKTVGCCNWKNKKKTVSQYFLKEQTAQYTAQSHIDIVSLATKNQNGQQCKQSSPAGKQSK